MDSKHDPANDEDHGQHEHAHGSLKLYISVFLALCGLTAVSVTVGNFMPGLRANAPGVMWAMMMAVSAAKAMLVIMFFMHLKWEANWKYVLTIPASIMSVFLMLMLIPDIGLRTRWYTEERWLFSAEPNLHADDHAGHEHDAGHGKAADNGNSGDEERFFHKEPAPQDGKKGAEH